MKKRRRAGGTSACRRRSVGTRWCDSANSSADEGGPVPPTRDGSREAAYGTLARDGNSYVVLSNRQCSTRPVAPRHNTSGRFACRLEQEIFRCKASLVVLLRRESIHVFNLNKIATVNRPIK